MSVAHTPGAVIARTGACAAVVVLLAGCAGEQDDTGTAFDDPGMGHVHGLGVDPASGDVLAATHTGLFRLQEGAEPERVADRWQDTMAFTVDGDRLLGSGHPDGREDLPVHLGLVESTDAGETWQPVSLLGEADLHALTVDGTDVHGWDSVTGTVLRSADGGRSWTSGARLDGVADLAVLPGAGGLLATTAAGLLVSTDGGQGFDRYDPEPPTMLTQLASRPGTPQPVVGVGVEGEGDVWSLTDGSWERVGTVGRAVTAFTVTPDGSMLASTDSAILVSTDQGQTWQQRAPLGPGSS